ncbi:hypothetical protein [Sphingobacterium hotanense]|uniref:Uncharacterized protein n=1 Tax=Sphingobacterium hotanense TaxID=649196 RepID=A0ABT7NQ38_9SPHI|nr:hypothetical protein [Sphingobacterium hotanense]MDM1049367.1 hypothetical protein [Sphingobacterium hotanense]
MIEQLDKRAKLYQKGNIEYVKFEILSIDTLSVGGLFYDVKVKGSAKHKASESIKVDTTMVMFSRDFYIID